MKTKLVKMKSQNVPLYVVNDCLRKMRDIFEISKSIYSDVRGEVMLLHERFVQKDPSKSNEPIVLTFSFEDYNDESDKIPPKLKELLDVCITKSSHDVSEISKVDITIYPPPKVSSGLSTTIQLSTMLSGPRFIVPINSDFKASYKLLDTSKITSFFSLPGQEHIDLDEHIQREKVVKIKGENASWINFIFDDLDEFEIRKRDGKGERTHVIRTLPCKRYVILFDLYTKAELYKEKLTEASEIITSVQSDSKKKKKNAIRRLAGKNQELKEDFKNGSIQVEEKHGIITPNIDFEKNEDEDEDEPEEENLKSEFSNNEKSGPEFSHLF